ncbi:MAG: DUF4238 domain-containing protein [Dongiaceae bacterium]
MSKDHFVAITYLKHFGDPGLNGMLHAYRKSDGATFRCWPKDVCHEWEGDENPEYLRNNPGALGNYRRIFETHWNRSVETLLAGRITHETKLLISAYIANLMTCTPAWRRVGIDSFEKSLLSYLSFVKRMKEKHGGQPELPVEAIKALEQGRIKISANPAYIKAAVTRQLLEQTWNIYNQAWVILKNETDEPFLTSDNPVALYSSPNIGDPFQRYLTINPKLALDIMVRRDLIIPFDADHASEYLRRPPMGRVVDRNAVKADVKNVNMLIVQCAEDLVFSSRASPVIVKLVKKYANYRVEAVVGEFPSPHEEDTTYIGTFIRAVEVNKAN